MSECRWSNGDEVYLRPFVREDITERYLGWFRDAEFTRFLDVRNLCYDDVERHFQAGIDSGAFRMFAICLAADDTHIGNVKIGPIHHRHMISDLVTTIGERGAWGRGYARCAIAVAISIAFGEMNIRKLSASIDSLNVGSIKAYTAAGFEIETALPNQFMELGPDGPVYSDKVYVCRYNPNFDPERSIGSPS